MFRRQKGRSSYPVWLHNSFYSDPPLKAAENLDLARSNIPQNHTDAEGWGICSLPSRFAAVVHHLHLPWASADGSVHPGPPQRAGEPSPKCAWRCLRLSHWALELSPALTLKDLEEMSQPWLYSAEFLPGSQPARAPHHNLPACKHDRKMLNRVYPRQAGIPEFILKQHQ